MCERRSVTLVQGSCLHKPTLHSPQITLTSSLLCPCQGYSMVGSRSTQGYAHSNHHHSRHVSMICCGVVWQHTQSTHNFSLDSRVWWGDMFHSKGMLVWLHSAQTQITQGRSPARCRPLVVHQEVHREDGVTSGSPRPPLAGSPHPPGWRWGRPAFPSHRLHPR